MLLRLLVMLRSGVPRRNSQSLEICSNGISVLVYLKRGLLVAIVALENDSRLRINVEATEFL